MADVSLAGSGQGTATGTGSLVGALNTDNWGRRIKVTIAASQVPSDLSEFPVYINLADLGARFFNNVQADGADVRVTRADGRTLAPREVVALDTGGQTGELHFKAKSVLSTSDTEFYIYFDNPSASPPATTDPYGRNAVWDNGYNDVFHLEEDPGGTAPQMVNSTGGANLESRNGLGSSDSIQGQIEQAVNFDVADFATFDGEYLEATGVSLPTTEGTVEVWFEPDNDYDSGNSQSQALSCCGIEGGDPRHLLYLSDDGSLRSLLQDASGNTIAQYSGTFPGDTWQHAAAKWNGSNNWIYYNGDQKDQVANSKSLSGSANQQLLASDDTAPTPAPRVPFAGSLDEYRVSNVERSSAWIEASYNNQNDPATFYSVSGAEALLSGSGEGTSTGTGRLKRSLRTENWGARVKVTIAASEVPSDQTDFPVYIDLADLGSAFFSLVEPDGSDIRVTKADEQTKLPREVAAIDTGSETGELYFEAENLSASSDTEFWIYFDNPSASAPAPTDATGPNAVWANGFSGVWHNQEDPTLSAPQMDDSTANGNDGTVSGSPASVNSVLGKALEFDDSGSVDIVETTSQALDGANQITISTWVEPTAFNADQRNIIASNYHENSETEGLVLQHRGDDNSFQCFWYEEDNPANAVAVRSDPHATGSRYLVTLVITPSESRVLIDGVQEGATAHNDTINPSDNGFSYGARVENSGPARPFVGVIDDMRLSVVSRSTDWVETTYTNQNSPTTFYSVSSVQTFIDFAGSGTGLATGSGSFTLTRQFSGFGEGTASGQGSITANVTFFSGAGVGVASGTGKLIRITPFVGSGAGAAVGDGALVLLRRFAGSGVARATGAGQVHTYFSGSGVGTATGVGLFTAASTVVGPVVSQSLMEPEDYRLFPQVDDTGTLNVTFDALKVNGVQVNSVPSWVEFDYFTRRINANKIDVVAYARVDISGALFQQTRANSLVWKAVVDDGSTTTSGEFEVRILDERVPSERTVLAFYDDDNEDIVKRSEILDTGIQSLFGINYDRDQVNKVRYDQLNQKFLIIEYAGNFDYELRSRDATGSFNGQMGSEDNGFAVGKDELRGLVLKLIRDEDRVRFFDYSTNAREYLSVNVGARMGNNVEDMAIEEDFAELFVVGEDLLGENAGIVKTPYRDSMYEKTTVPSSQTGRVRSVEVDHFNRVLVTVEQDHQKLVVRDARDLSVKNEHDFGNTNSFWGISLDEANKRIFFSRDDFSGIQSTPYALDGTFNQEVAGNYRWPIVMVDSKRGLPSEIEIVETRVDDENITVEVVVQVTDVSGFSEYRLVESPVPGGNFQSVAKKGREKGEQVTLVHENASDQSRQYYKGRTLTSEGETEDESAERFTYPFSGAVTKGFEQDAEWTDPDTDYFDLSPSTVASARVVVDLEAGDDGIIMEAGANGDGLALFTDGSTLYFACGDGTGTSSDDRTAWIEASMPTGNNVVIEWSASADSNSAALYVNGTKVGSDTFTEENIAGGNEGSIAGERGGLRDVASGVDENGFDGEILSCRIFKGETTSDV